MFFNCDAACVTTALLQCLKRCFVLHVRYVIFGLRTRGLPFISDNDRLTCAKGDELSSCDDGTGCSSVSPAVPMPACMG